MTDRARRAAPRRAAWSNRGAGRSSTGSVPAAPDKRRDRHVDGWRADAAERDAVGVAARSAVPRPRPIVDARRHRRGLAGLDPRRERAQRRLGDEVHGPVVDRHAAIDVLRSARRRDAASACAVPATSQSRKRSVSGWRAAYELRMLVHVGLGLDVEHRRRLIGAEDGRRAADRRRRCPPTRPVRRAAARRRRGCARRSRRRRA